MTLTDYYNRVQVEYRTNGEPFTVDIIKPWPVQPWMLCQACDGSGMSRYWVQADEHSPEGAEHSEPCELCGGLGMRPEVYAQVKANIGPHRDSILGIKNIGSRLHRLKEERKREDPDEALVEQLEQVIKDLLDWVKDTELGFIPTRK